MAEKRTAFQNALLDAVELRYEEKLAQDAAPVEFSAEHKAFVEKLTKKSSRRSWRLVNTTAKRILLAAIIALLLIATVCAAVPAIRKNLIRYQTRSDGGGLNFEFSKIDLEKAPKEIQTYYAPSYIPKGYELVEEISSQKIYMKIYLNKMGYVTDYSQHILWEFNLPDDASAGDISVFGISADYSSMEILNIDGYEVRVYHYKQSDTPEEMLAVWTDYQYLYTFGCPELSNKELEKVIQSMQVVKPEN